MCPPVYFKRLVSAGGHTVIPLSGEMGGAQKGCRRAKGRPYIVDFTENNYIKDYRSAAAFCIAVASRISTLPSPLKSATSS